MHGNKIIAPSHFQSYSVIQSIMHEYDIVCLIGMLMAKVSEDLEKMELNIFSV